MSSGKWDFPNKSFLFKSQTCLKLVFFRVLPLFRGYATSLLSRFSSCRPATRKKITRYLTTGAKIRFAARKRCKLGFGCSCVYSKIVGIPSYSFWPGYQGTRQNGGHGSRCVGFHLTVTTDPSIEQNTMNVVLHWLVWDFSIFGVIEVYQFIVRPFLSRPYWNSQPSKPNRVST